MKKITRTVSGKSLNATFKKIAANIKKQLRLDRQKRLERETLADHRTLQEERRIETLAKRVAEVMSDIIKKSSVIREQFIESFGHAAVHVECRSRPTMSSGILLCPNSHLSAGIILMIGEHISGSEILRASIESRSASASKVRSRIHENLTVFIAEPRHVAMHGTVWRKDICPSRTMKKKLKGLTSVQNVLQAFAEHFVEDY